MFAPRCAGGGVEAVEGAGVGVEEEAAGLVAGALPASARISAWM